MSKVYGLSEIFVKSFYKLLEGNAADTYIAILKRVFFGVTDKQRGLK